MSELKRVLFDTYGGFADKRIKKLEKGQFFIVDTRKEGGLASDGQPFGWFCSVTADVRSETEVGITLLGSIADEGRVQEWLTKYGLKINRQMGQQVLGFAVTPANYAMLDELADATASIVAPGERYSVASYKYACPRTAYSLKQLKAALDKVWLPAEVVLPGQPS